MDMSVNPHVVSLSCHSRSCYYEIDGVTFHVMVLYCADKVRAYRRIVIIYNIC